MGFSSVRPPANLSPTGLKYSWIKIKVDKVASRSANNRGKENAKRFPSAY